MLIKRIPISLEDSTTITPFNKGGSSTQCKLAPHEIWKSSSKSYLKATTELTLTERNRNRRLKKKLKGDLQKQKDLSSNTAANLQASSSKRSKFASVQLEKKEALKTLSKSSNVTIMCKKKKNKNLK